MVVGEYNDKTRQDIQISGIRHQILMTNKFSSSSSIEIEIEIDALITASLLSDVGWRAKIFAASWDLANEFP